MTLSFSVVEILAYCCMHNANRSSVSLKSTFSNCHVLFCYICIIWYTHRCTRHKYSNASHVNNNNNNNNNNNMYVCSMYVLRCDAYHVLWSELLHSRTACSFATQGMYEDQNIQQQPSKSHMIKSVSY